MIKKIKIQLGQFVSKKHRAYELLLVEFVS